MRSLSTKRRFNLKLWLFVVGGLLVVVALAFGGLWYAASQANAQYMTTLEQVGEGLKQKLTDGTAKIQEITKKTNSGETADALNNLAGSLEVQLDTVPAEPNLLGLPLLNPGARSAKEEIITKTRTLADRLHNSALLLIYERDIFTGVVQVKDLTGNDQAEQESLAKGWLDLLNDLKTKVNTPEPAKEVHQQLIDSVTSIQSTLAELPELTKKKDQSGFSAKEKELESKIAGLRELNEALRAAYLAQDKAVAEAHTALLQVLP